MPIPITTQSIMWLCNQDEELSKPNDIKTGMAEQCIAHNIDVKKPAVSGLILKNERIDLLLVIKSDANVRINHRLCNIVAFIFEVFYWMDKKS